MGFVVKKKEKDEDGEKSNESSDSSSNTISEGDDLGAVLVPSTPKSKLKKKAEAKMPNDDDENVMQTPLDKLNRVPRRRNEKLAALLEKTLKAQAESPKKMGSSAKIHPKKSSVTSSSALCSTNYPSRTRSARVNLNERFAAEDKLKKESNSSSSISPEMLRAPISLTLDKKIIGRYRKRIEEIRQSAPTSNKDEVFYGRCTSRHNLFDDSIDKKSDEKIKARSTCIQKNRSGRSVQASQKVYMAHALLNVYNNDPLNPSKPPKEASFKLHRLIRPACKSDKKKLSKLRLRVAREKSLPSLWNSASCAEDASDSSHDSKAKSESPPGKFTEGNEERKFDHMEKLSEKESLIKSEDVFKEPDSGKLSKSSTCSLKNTGTSSDSSCASSVEKRARKRKGSSSSANGLSLNQLHYLDKLQDESPVRGELVKDLNETKKIAESFGTAIDFVPEGLDSENASEQIMNVDQETAVGTIGYETENQSGSMGISNNIEYETEDRLTSSEISTNMKERCAEEMESLSNNVEKKQNMDGS
ncbi:unnamed protein product [Thelazia callipaeda]|uniref:PPP1R26_N domain-containing protein n=1 Tax=Thelazia callipaeda TaxID=103827 RepID=A0A0N5D0J3_THECL|nr:unnamed protein product [Thelazia callipaeda]